MRIAIDVDDVLCGLVEEVVEIYNDSWGDTLTKDKITVWNMSRFVKPQCGTFVQKYFNMPGLYDNVRPIPGAQMGVEKLRSYGCELLFVTAALPDVMGEKFKWLQAYGFTDDLREYIVAKNKSVIQAHVLLDDNYDNTSTFRGYGMLYTQPWNDKHNVKYRVNNWEEFDEFIRRML
jgi:5'(3')-deoxyribonucleotidase